MPFQEFVVSEQLTGMDRNSAEGVSAAPRSVVNLEPSAVGGYQLRGVELRFGSTSYAVLDDLFGYDHKGYASLGLDNGPSREVRVASERFSTSSSSISEEGYKYGVHLPSAGFYGGADDFLVRDAENGAHTTRNGIYPSVTVGTGGDFAAGYYAVFTVLYLKTRESRLALMAYRKFVEFAAAGGTLTVGFSSAPPATYSIDVFVSQKLPGTTSPQVYGYFEFFQGGTVDASSSPATLTFDDVPIGPQLALNGFGVPYVVPLSRGDGLRPLALHRGRTYFVPNNADGTEELYWQTTDGTGAPNKLTGDIYKATAKIFNQLTLAWTEANTLNLFNYLTSYQSVSAKNSTAITALSSTQDGLLIFCQNETFLMRGDPSFIAAGRFADFNITPLFPVGCDEQVGPGELGPLVFSIWKGEVYQVTASGYENISQPVWDRNDPFTQVVGDVERNCIVCRADSGRTFYYYPDDRFWGEGPEGVKYLLPNPTASGSIYYIKEGTLGLFYVQLLRFYGDSPTPARPRVAFEADMGLKYMRKSLKYVRVPVNQGFAGSCTLTYQADRGVTRTVTGRRKGDELLFPIREGCVGRVFKLTFDFTSMKVTDTIEAPFIVEFTPRDVKR